MRTLTTALIAALAATPAVAGDLQDGSGRKPWTANVGYGRVMDDGTDAASSPSYSGGLERAFGEGLRVTPSGSVYRRRTISSTEGQGGFASGRKSNDGVTGRLGLDFSADVAPRLSISAGGAGVASSNAASVYRLSGLARTSAPQSFGESEAASWGEVSLGAALDLGAASLSVGAAATIGLAEDTVTVSVGASAPF